MERQKSVEYQKHMQNYSLIKIKVQLQSYQYITYSTQPGIKEIKSPQEKLIYKHHCQICNKFYKQIVKTSCCQNQTCINCINLMLLDLQPQQIRGLVCMYCRNNQFKFLKLEHDEQIMLNIESPNKLIQNSEQKQSPGKIKNRKQQFIKQTSIQALSTKQNGQIDEQIDYIGDLENQEIKDTENINVTSCRQDEHVYLQNQLDHIRNNNEKINQKNQQIYQSIQVYKKQQDQRLDQ